MRALLRTLAALVACLPWSALRLPGEALGLLAGTVLRIRRGAVEEAMARAHVDDVPAAARAMYASLGRGVFELLWLAGASEARRARVLRECVAFEPGALEALHASLARGPVLLAASHTGNWELVAFATARRLADEGRRLVVVAKPFSLSGFDRFTRELRAAFGVDVVEPRGAASACIERLRRGDVVVMPIDQVPDRDVHALRMSVLGELAWTDRAPATIAARAEAEVLVVAAKRRSSTQHVSVLACVPPRTDAVRAWVDQTTRDTTVALESFVGTHPAAWMWLHRRWRAPKVLRSARHPPRTARLARGGSWLVARGERD